MSELSSGNIPVLSFLHLGVATASLENAVSVYQDLFGYRVLSGPYRDPIQKVSVCFLGTGAPGDIVIELVAPDAEDSPIRRILSKGGGAYHVCYQAEDMTQALSELSAKGCLMVSDPAPAVAFGGRRIAWLYTPTRELIEVVEK